MPQLRSLLALLLLAVSLSALTQSASITCGIAGRTLKPGESYVFEQNCARHNCTCDPSKSGSEMCISNMIGCLHGSTCYSNGDAAAVTSSDGRTLHCTCQLTGGSYEFANCRSETCTDSRTGEQKTAGQQVTTVSNGVTYICTCAGVDGYRNCRTEQSVNNEGKCLDSTSGNYVDTGAAVTHQQGGTVYHCTCAGTNSYANCRTTTCRDVDGSVKNTGEKVTVSSGGTLYVCDCAGLEGYKNCITKADYDNSDKCKAMDGSYAEVGQRYRVVSNGVTLECTCDGANRGSACTAV